MTRPPPDRPYDPRDADPLTVEPEPVAPPPIGISWWRVAGCLIVLSPLILVGLAIAALLLAAPRSALDPTVARPGVPGLDVASGGASSARAPADSSGRVPSGAPHGEAIPRTRGIEPATTPDPAQQAAVGAPVPPGELGTPLLAGDANFADPSHGPDYLAIRADRGTRVRICGAGECQELRSTDYGPAKRTGDVADIALVRFAAICGYTLAEARRRGECFVEIEFLGSGPTLPPTDGEP